MKRFSIITLAVLAAVGCASTTTTYPDGRIVEERRIDPEFLSAAIALGQSALQLAAAERAESTPPLRADLARVELIVAEVQAILVDGVTVDEYVRLRELYDEVQAILAGQGVKVNLKVKT